MSEPISIFNVIKRGGYEASLITTFNATLPFYEEVLLRKLVGSGCRHNVVLMDRSQCSVSWRSEATRPRLAGHAYTLLPIAAPGAFHPKLCILVGPKKASVLIGSHNLTLSGFGYNREITNWIEIAGAKDSEGAALLSDAWSMTRQWIEMERGKTSDALIEAALSLAKFIEPLASKVKPSADVFALTHTPFGLPLLDQISNKISASVRRISVIGAFFDKELALVGELTRRWPTAEVVVGIDPQSVQLLAKPVSSGARYVDTRHMWPVEKGYLHAKAIYFDCGDENSAFVSGSANPSRPAWIGPATSSNVEAVLLRIGAGAREAAAGIGLDRIFGLAEVDPGVFDAIVERSSTEVRLSESPSAPMWTGTACSETGKIQISCRGTKPTIDRVDLFCGDMQLVETVKCYQKAGEELIGITTGGVDRVRSCLLYSGDLIVARAMIHHPQIISALAQSTRQHQIRAALSGLGSGEGDISKVIASVERVIFSEEAFQEVQRGLREHKATPSRLKTDSDLETLAISVADMPKEKKKVRVLKSGDLAYLIDVLLRRLSEGLNTTAPGTDTSGRTEEEQVGADGDEENRMAEPALPGTTLSDREVALAVSRRARALTRRMVDQLKLASKDTDRRASAVLQLIAVLALVRELRHLDKTPRWRAAGHLLVDVRDRRYLLDEALKYLLGSTFHMLDEVDRATGCDTEEGVQLKVLLLWLAWDLGEELSEQVRIVWDASERKAKLCANAIFLKLIPPVVAQSAARAELERSISLTVHRTPEAATRASTWLKRHLQFGDLWSSGARVGGALRIGGYCRVLGTVDEPRVVIDLTDRVVEFWDFDRIRGFARTHVVGVVPAIPDSLTA